jgi:hypothetical protein
MPFMHTYISAMNLGLSVEPHVAHRDLYLDVEYQVENSEVAVKAVHVYGDDTPLVLPKDACLTLAQQIKDNLVFGY